MKYKYTIFAQSDLEEDELVTKMEQAGLTKIFVEKYVNIERILRDENKFLDENFDAKWEKIKASGIIRYEEMIECIEKHIKNAECKSMYTLMNSIREAGVECELPDAAIGVMMSRCQELLSN